MSKGFFFFFLFLFSTEVMAEEGNIFSLPEPFSSFVSQSGRHLDIQSEPSSGFQLHIEKSEAEVDSKSYWSYLGSYEDRFHLVTWDESGRSREYRGDVTRVYPQRLPEFQKPQLFREKVVLYQGERESGLQWLTIRQDRPDIRDSVWAYSPALKRVRRMNSVNREDRILNSAFSLDDFHLFSRREHGLKMLDKEEARLLVPLVLDRALLGEKQDSGCMTIRPASLRRAAQLLYGQASSPQERIVHWLSSEKFFPRNVYRLSYEALNPYREIAHEVLIVDAATELPLYRNSYDVLGRLRYSSYQVFGAAQIGDARLPALAYSLIYDHEKERVTVLAPQEQQWCPITESLLSTFQPKGLIGKLERHPL